MASAYSNKNNVKPKRLLLGELFTVGWELREVNVPETVVGADGKAVPFTPKYRDTLSGSWTAYKDHSKTLLKASLYFLIFLLPMLVLVFYGFGAIKEKVIPASLNFMGNMGVGYPGVADSVIYAKVSLLSAWQMFMYLSVPAIFVISFGIAGLFNVAKKIIWNEPIKYVAKPFFDGIKKFWLKMILPIMFGTGVALAMSVALIYHLSALETSSATAGSWCACIFTFVFGAPLLIFPMVMMTLIPSYQLSFGELIKDSLVLFVNRFIPYALVGILTAAPLLILALFSNAFITVLLILVLAAFGFSLWSMLWTGLGHGSYLRCVYIHELNESTASAPKKKQTEYTGTVSSSGANPKKKPPQKTSFQNPKKKKKK